VKLSPLADVASSIGKALQGIEGPPGVASDADALASLTASVVANTLTAEKQLAESPNEPWVREPPS
jgi:hypothetical protein